MVSTSSVTDAAARRADRTSRPVGGVAYVSTRVPFPRSSSLPYAHLQAPESYIILLWKQCTCQDGVYLLHRVQRVYGGFGPFVVDQTREWYCAWSGLNTKRHIGKYYNMAFKKCYYLNGALLNQQELVLPEPGMQFGIDETVWPAKIRRRLELPSVVLFDDADDCSPLSDSSSCSL